MSTFIDKIFDSCVLCKKFIERSPWLIEITSILLTVLVYYVYDSFQLTVGYEPTLSIFLFPIIFSTYLGGFWLGLSTTIFAAILTNYLVLPPTYSFSLAVGLHSFQWLTLIILGVTINVMVGALHAKLYTKPLKEVDSTERKVQAGFIATLILSFVIGFISYYHMDRLIEHVKLVRQSELTLLTLDRIYSTLSEIGTLERDFILTMDHSYVVTFNDRTASIDADLVNLASMLHSTSNNGKLNELKELINRKIKLLQDAIKLRDSNSTNIKSLTQDTEHVLLKEEIKTYIDKLKSEEMVYLAEKERSVYVGNIWVKTSISIGCGLSFILISVALYMVRQDFVLSRKAKETLILAKRELELKVQERTEALKSNAILIEEQETLYTKLFANMLNGCAYCKMIYDEDKPVDFLYLAANPAFEKLTGLRDVIGRTVTEVIPGIEKSNPELFELYGKTAATGESCSFEIYLPILNSWFAATAYSYTVGYFVSIFDNITERKKAEELIQDINTSLEQQVEKRTAELTAANKELESFSYAVSHDLRAPLRSMSGFSQALLEDYGSILTGEAKEYLNHIIDSSKHMAELIDGILTLSRSTRGDLSSDVINISALCTKILRELTHLEPSRNVKWDVEPGLAALGDNRMVEIVLSNLLGNAWKYTSTKEKAIINVFGDIVEEEQWIHIKDNGAGFDMAHASKLFLPFQRLHRQEEFTGIGIGLATAERIVNRHGGKIVAESKLGEGATFSFSLPSITVQGDA